MRRSARWIVLLVCLICLAKILFGRPNAWVVAGFFLCGALWYWLTWLKTRELDAPKPR